MIATLKKISSIIFLFLCLCLPVLGQAQDTIVSTPKEAPELMEYSMQNRT